jgi:hypothetical protein
MMSEPGFGRQHKALASDRPPAPSIDAARRSGPVASNDNWSFATRPSAVGKPHRRRDGGQIDRHSEPLELGVDPRAAGRDVDLRRQRSEPCLDLRAGARGPYETACRVEPLPLRH